MAFQVPWALLNQVVTRRRPVESSQSNGAIIIDGFSDQVIQARVQEKMHKGRGAEQVVNEGIATERHFVFDMNYVIAPGSSTATDVKPTDRLVIVDAGVTLLCRIDDLHDAAGARHHIIGTAIWTSPVGD